MCAVTSPREMNWTGLDPSVSVCGWRSPRTQSHALKQRINTLSPLHFQLKKHNLARRLVATANQFLSGRPCGLDLMMAVVLLPVTCGCFVSASSLGADLPH